MEFAQIYRQFNNCNTWEDRYRLLIQLSRQLEKPNVDTLAQWQEIQGCESRLWFHFQLSPRQIHAYSESRLMQGLLVILISMLKEKTVEQLKTMDIQASFDELQITRYLTTTRLNGLKQLESIINNTLI